MASPLVLAEFPSKKVGPIFVLVRLAFCFTIILPFWEVSLLLALTELAAVNFPGEGVDNVIVCTVVRENECNKFHFLFFENKYNANCKIEMDVRFLFSNFPRVEEMVKFPAISGFLEMVGFPDDEGAVPTRAAPARPRS